jgi:hypothetical protein
MVSAFGLGPTGVCCGETPHVGLGPHPLVVRR